MGVVDKIKAILFDLDGVLVDAKEIHYEAFNNALAKFNYTIEREEHLSTYNGLPTKKKLQILTEKKSLPVELYDEIWKEKQNETIRILKKLERDERIVSILKTLTERGYHIAVCSNSISESTKIMLLKRGFLEYVDFYLSNQDVIFPKPSPEMYFRAMIRLNAKPKECVIVEDSPVGIQSALNTGSHLLTVKDSADVTLEKIEVAIENAEFLNKTLSTNIPIVYQT